MRAEAIKEDRMSRQELVDAYLGGGLSRRAFVRRLVASGVSVGAAMGYAQVLAPEAEAAPLKRRTPQDDQYPILATKIVTRDMHDVRHNKRLRLRITTNTAVVVHVGAFVNKGGHLFPLGFVPADPQSARTLAAYQTKTITIPFNQDSTASNLAGLKKAQAYVQTWNDSFLPFSVAKATLK
jgi:hypothetical protein